MRRRFINTLAPAIALSIGLAASGLAAANPNQSTVHHNYPRTLQRMIDAGSLKVLRQFPTAKDGLTGYLVRHNGYTTVVYGNNGYLMFGPLIGPHGQNLSRQYKRQYKPKPNIGKIIEGLDSAHLITQGPANAPHLYVFADPNCIYCHRFYHRVEPLVRTGRLRVTTVLVDVIKPSSRGRAAAILTAHHPAQALKNNETRFDEQHEAGGIAPQQPDQSIAAALKAHRQAMMKVGGTGTPTVVYHGANGRWAAHVGVPPAAWFQSYAQSASTIQGEHRDATD